MTGLESLGIHRERVSSNRGNAYLPPGDPEQETSKQLALPSWDCKPSGGEVEANPAPVGADAGAAGSFDYDFPHVGRSNYRR